MTKQFTAGMDVQKGDCLRIVGTQLFSVHVNERWDFIAQDDYVIGQSIEIEVDERSEQASQFSHVA